MISKEMKAIIVCGGIWCTFTKNPREIIKDYRHDDNCATYWSKNCHQTDKKKEKYNDDEDKKKFALWLNQFNLF